MDALSLAVGASLGILFCIAINSFLYLRRNPTLPPLDGYIVVTRRGGLQHYRKVCGSGKSEIEDSAV
jgi:hypothetical protein